MHKSDKQAVRLMQQIKAGRLKFGRANDDKVQNALCDAYMWRYIFEEAGLAALPDPEGIWSEGIKLFEEWIVDAHSALTEQSSEEIRECLKKLELLAKQEVDSGRVGL